ncbi:MAG: acyltransferase [Proteobacteria bacterium]|nr:acyltransferase [Pseudomonadota bacterium]
MDEKLLNQIKILYNSLSKQMRQRFNRHVSFGDLITDRYETARRYGFAEGVSCYDNVLIIGDVKVAHNTWIGPNVILDGGGGLEIGSYCSISAGVQIYTHDTVKWATSQGKQSSEAAPVKIGSGVYIGPQSVIQKGVTIGDEAIIGAMSFVNRDIPPGMRAWGIPARIHPI